MVEAEFVKLPSGYSIPTGRPDMPTLSLYTFAVYIPSHQLLIKTVDVKELMKGGKPLDLSFLDIKPYERYEVIIGDNARSRYNYLKQDLVDLKQDAVDLKLDVADLKLDVVQLPRQITEYINPQTSTGKIDVSDSFITWAKALHDVKNPPREVSRLLDDIVG